MALDRALEPVADTAGGANEQRDQQRPAEVQAAHGLIDLARRLISSAAAVPVWSATSNDLRSSSSSRL